MSVVAKFFVQSVKRQQEGQAEVTLGAVCRGVENALWSQYTPAGQIVMHVRNDAATDQFVQGQEFLVTLEPVAKPAPHDGHALRAVVDKHGALVCETCGNYSAVAPQDRVVGPDGRLDWAASKPNWDAHAELFAPLAP